MRITPSTAGEVAIGTAIENLKGAFPRLDIRFEGDPGLVMALSDENARIVLGHLADNAGRHGATSLDIRATRDASGLRVGFRDDGAGISSSNADRVFDSFFTTRREDGGTGMGLAIVRALLERHGGWIALDRSHPSGAAFDIRLP